MVYGNRRIAFILPLLFLLPAEILPEGVQGCQLLQAHAAAAGEGAGELGAHLQQAAASGLRRGQHRGRGEPAAPLAFLGTQELWGLGWAGREQQELMERGCEVGQMFPNSRAGAAGLCSQEPLESSP